MLSTLEKLKARLSIVETDITHDDLLTAALDAVSSLPNFNSSDH
jgi:hypothetical protein